MPKFFFIPLFLLSITSMTGQSIYTEFGKNRVQYHDDFDDWWMYESENFVTYWYGKGRNVAETVVQFAELDNDAIQNVLEHRFNDKIEIIVYVDLTDMKQTNIGAEELFASQPDRTRIVGNKMFVYFDGDHQALRQRIREGIAAVYLESMLFGGNLQEVVQNAVLLNLPDWFSDGLIAYLGKDWTSDVEGQMLDLWNSRKGKYRDFDRLARDYPQIAGHSMWFYLGRAYGKSSISNLLYLSRINRHLENAFQYVLGTSLDNVKVNWQHFFEQRFNSMAEALDPLAGDVAVDVKNKKNRVFTELSLSPDGTHLIYALNDIGKTKVYLRHLETGETARIMKFGMRNIIEQTDFHYPLISWAPDGQSVAIIHERRDVLYLTKMNFADGVQVVDPLGPEFQRVYSLDYWTPDTLIFAATNNGFTDLFKYAPVTRQSFRITDDFYDDLDARVFTLGEQKGILWRSNRTNLRLEKRDIDTILPLENFDIYFMYPTTKDHWQLLNLTQTPLVNETKPIAIGDRSIIYLSHETGVWNRKSITGPLSNRQDIDYQTNYDRNILDHTTAPHTGRIFEYMILNGRHQLIESTPEKINPVQIGEVQKDDARAGPEDTNMDELNVRDERYLFQSEFAPPTDIAPALPILDTVPPEPVNPDVPIDFLKTPSTDDEPVMYDQSKVVPFISSRAIAHRLRFKIDYINTTLDNSLLFTTLDAYAGIKQGFENPPLGILIRGNIKDLFEDYVVEGGIRIPTSFNGAEYYLKFDNRKRRIDQTYALYRSTTNESFDGGVLGNQRRQFVTAIGQASFRYPFDVYRSVTATATIRNDRFIPISTDFPSLEAPIDDEQRIGAKFEYVFDNTLDLDINYKHGTRYKVWVEFVKKFDLNLFEEDMPITFNDGFMTVLGVDARHYQRLDKHSIFAMRFMASTSIGSERNLYYLGGMENWMFSEFNKNIPVPSDKNFAFQTVAANMRGFKYNARNGSSVALANFELRVPFLRYLSKRKIKSSFLRNLQVVAFTDFGTAWHGSDPFSTDNPLNTVTLNNPPTVSVEVKYYRNPVVIGYGAGVRTMIFGYFLKLDYGWGLETKRVNKPILYLSMGTDF